MISESLFQYIHFGITWGIAIGILLLDWKDLLSPKVLKGISLGFVLYLLGRAAMKGFLQWSVWNAHPVTQTFSEDPAYFPFYVTARFFQPVLFTLASSFIFGGILSFLAWHSKGVFVNRAEVWLGIVAALLTGWPGNLLLVAFTFLFMFGMSVLQRLFPKKQAFQRVPFAPFLFGSMILLLVFGAELISLFHLRVIKA